MTTIDRGGHSGRDEGRRPSDPGYDLGVLDPGRDDASFWARFRFRVMTRASDELLRRRLMAEVTALELVQSWARTMMPVAAVAATVAGLLLFQGQRPGSAVAVGVEEALTRELEDQTLPEFMQQGGDDVAFLLTGETF